MRQIVNANLQRYWDWRAVGNFSGGGTGTGLVVAAALAWATGAPSMLALVAGLGFVGLGLLFVWFEIGRPWRAINVFFHPHTSWMTREALLGPPLMAAGAAALFLDFRFVFLAALFAAGYLYCQARMLHASRGIPAWCQKELPLLIVATGLAEGTGLYLVIAEPSAAMIAAALLAGIFREVVREIYRRGLIQSKAPAGTLAWFSLPAENVLSAGRLASIIFLALALIGWRTAALGGLLAVVTGWGLKFMLITRAAYLRGPILQHTPVRGQGPSHVIVPS
jgi:phenylacetyl-CoA:acceptor oxidoreductase subunit 2